MSEDNLELLRNNGDGIIYQMRILLRSKGYWDEFEAWEQRHMAMALRYCLK